MVRAALSTGLVDVWAAFTPREREVAELLFHRYAPKQIGERLGVTTDTVRAHIRNAGRTLKRCDEFKPQAPAAVMAAAYDRAVLGNTTEAKAIGF